LFRAVSCPLKAIALGSSAFTSLSELLGSPLLISLRRRAAQVARLRYVHTTPHLADDGYASKKAEGRYGNPLLFVAIALLLWAIYRIDILQRRVERLHTKVNAIQRAVAPDDPHRRVETSDLRSVIGGPSGSKGLTAR